KPRTLLGERLNDTATGALGGVDVVCLVVDATAPLGRGDRFVAGRVPRDAIVVVNKTDVAKPDEVLSQLAAAATLDLSEYFPVSARTGDGVDALVDAIVARMPEGPQYYPDDMITDVPEAFWVAELVREQLLAVVRDEVPHSVATRVTEWDWPRVRCEILVERDSQKGIVIGKGGEVLKQVGIAVRAQMPPGVFLELFVKVDKDWQRHAEAMNRFGY
ncbi:MAG: GTPase, partial [Acidimicrobiaceae bacterium]